MREGKRSAARAKRFRLRALCWPGARPSSFATRGATGTVIERLEPGEVFAEAYACLPGEPLAVSVAADAPTRVMFLGVSRVLLDGA